MYTFERLQLTLRPTETPVGYRHGSFFLDFDAIDVECYSVSIVMALAGRPPAVEALYFAVVLQVARVYRVYDLLEILTEAVDYERSLRHSFSSLL